jgi:hypothetical protein
LIRCFRRATFFRLFNPRSLAMKVPATPNRVPGHAVLGRL